MNQTTINFDGPSIEPADAQRMGRQLEAVYRLMSDGKWRTLAEVRWTLNGQGIASSEAGISARLRDLRKQPFNHTVDRRRRTQGVWEYRVTT